MADTDWKEILSFSQKDLKEADKEKLCESLSWMEPDDIELNFADIKTLFRLAQDILKYKNEQVKNLAGQLESLKKKSKGKSKRRTESPVSKSEEYLETIAHQEEIIKANKELIDTLHSDIAELEERKKKVLDDSRDVDSESSRSVLSELNAVRELENEVSSKNRHIRKLIGDIKSLENDNSIIKGKVSVLKDKLSEATQLIENLTDRLFNLNNDNEKLKEIIGSSEEVKTNLYLEIELLKKELVEKESKQENSFEEIKAKVQHWKSLAKSNKAEIQALFTENEKLKELLQSQSRRTSPNTSPKKSYEEKLKVQELQEKLSQATTEMLESVYVIENLRKENKKLKTLVQEMPDYSVSDMKNESDEGKERALISKLKREIKCQKATMQGMEEMITEREKELAEIASQLQLLQSDEGIKNLLDNLKSKTRRLKSRDQGIKTLVQEINSLSQDVDNLQIENKILREKLNIPVDAQISNKGVIKKYNEMEKLLVKLQKESTLTDSKITDLELKNHELTSEINRFTNFLLDNGFTSDVISTISQHSQEMLKNKSNDLQIKQLQETISKKNKEYADLDKELKAVIEQNEGLRKSLTELFDYLKDNSSTTSGVLAIECPSLESVLQSMEARNAAGWFAPHMTTIMELREAKGGRDALLTALHQARKETFDVMNKLSKESTKCSELEQQLQEVKQNKVQENSDGHYEINDKFSIGEFGSWMLNNEEHNINLNDADTIEYVANERNRSFEEQLKNNLLYFSNKFKELYEKMTTIAIQAMNDQNNWKLQEEQYKNDIEELKTLINEKEDEDVSDVSPGIVPYPSISTIQRKCVYLEDSYKYYKALNENLKNEYIELKIEFMKDTANYEIEIQKLLLLINKLSDKLRNSISFDLFKKQNLEFNEITIKYRQYTEESVKSASNTQDFQKALEIHKAEIIDEVSRKFIQHESHTQSKVKDMLNDVELSVLQKQLQQVCQDLDQKDNELKSTQAKLVEVQRNYATIIDQTLCSDNTSEVNFLKEENQKLGDQCAILKEQCRHQQNQLNIALLQLRDSEQRHLNNELELNMLKHQILDLQSTGDNKAIIARLSNEVLVAHLQETENYKKMERLNTLLSREREMRVEAEEILQARERVFEVYSNRYETKFKYMYELLHILRQQYQGSLPLLSVEKYLDNLEECSRKTISVNEKLNEIEDLRTELITRLNVYEQALDMSKNKCLDDYNGCSHELQLTVNEGTSIREKEHLMEKIDALEKSREDMIKYCNYLERTLVYLSQAFQKSDLVLTGEKTDASDNYIKNLELVDVQSDDDTSSRKSQTISLPKPLVLKPSRNNIDMTSMQKEEIPILLGSPIKPSTPSKPEIRSIVSQTSPIKSKKQNKNIQTEEDREGRKLQNQIKVLENYKKKINDDIQEANKMNKQLESIINLLQSEKNTLESSLQNSQSLLNEKDVLIKNLEFSLEQLTRQVDELRNLKIEEKLKAHTSSDSENKSLLMIFQQLEKDKQDIIAEYKTLLQNERDEYAKSVKELQQKMAQLVSNDDKMESNLVNSSHMVDPLTNKYTAKIAELEEKCFKLQSDLDQASTELQTCRREMDRWKSLAADRLQKLESLNSQLDSRHSQEVDSYKAENQHWLDQLKETQKEHMELRTRLSEQKSAHVKMMAEKDAHIEQLRTVNNNLKTQVLNMQTVIAVNDPSFDLSAIVEVEEITDGASQYGSDRLEIKFDSMDDLQDGEGLKPQASSTAIWQEPVVDRLRREKQQTSKQNSILRRQIKALAARERRARLDAQNLRNQVFRISTSGKKLPTAEVSVLHSKIASLQSQLTSARKDTHSSVALWDKWKRAQQSSDRWQSRFEEKCMEVRKLESALNLAKGAVSRLEKEKRILLARLSEANQPTSDNTFFRSLPEKQDVEQSEKSPRCEQCALAPVSARALLERVEAQQRRIAALEIADRGNEYLVSEYEKSLAEVTSLKGQVLKLESALLESQLQRPLQSKDCTQPELEYWKNYCEMLKEENVQLTLRVNSLDSSHHHSGQHKVNDLEQTVLTLRGLVSKLQAEQKSGGHKRIDSRPSSGRSAPDKNRSQLESHRIEIANLKRSILDKDILLERSKEMLKIAADREDELLRENARLRRRLEELTKPPTGFLSA